MSLPPSTVSTDPTYPLHPTLSFLGFVLCLIPLPWHVHASNSATCAFMIWTALWCLNGFVNSVVWRANLSNPAPIWCDISTKFDVGASIGIPAAVLCISRRIYVLMSLNASSMTQREKRRMIILDLLICAVLPVVIMILHFIVQDHRFDILQDIGCYTVIYNTPLAYILVLMWPVILGLISLVYSVLSLRLFILSRKEFARIRDSTSSVSLRRYSRLAIFAFLDVVCTVPLGIYSVYIGPRGSTLRPWVSFRNNHSNFSRVEFIPTSEWRGDASYHFSVELMRWMHVYCAFLFFAAFGLTADARLHYRNALLKVFKGAEHSYHRLSYRDTSASERDSEAKFSMSSTWTKPPNFSIYSTSTPRTSTQGPSPRSSGFTKTHRYYPSDASTLVALEKPPLSHAKTVSGEEGPTSYHLLSLPPFTPFYTHGNVEALDIDSLDASSTLTEELPNAGSSPAPLVHSHSRPPSQVPDDISACVSLAGLLDAEAGWRPQRHSLDVEFELHPGVYP